MFYVLSGLFVQGLQDVGGNDLPQSEIKAKCKALVSAKHLCLGNE